MTTRIIRSDELGVFGEIATGTVTIQVLFSYGTEDNIDHGIHVTKGARSRYDYFVTVPIDTYGTIVEMHNEEVFIEALRKMTELLEPR